MPSKNRHEKWPTATGELSFASPTRTNNQADIVITEPTPARRYWLPETLEKLLPWMIQGVREVASWHDTKLLEIRRDGLVPLYLDWYGVKGVDGWYAFAAADFAVHVGDEPPKKWPSRNDKDRPKSMDTLVRIATGYDEGFSSIDDLEPGPVQLIHIASDTPRVLFELDEDNWRETGRKQRKQGLRTIALLSKACKVELRTSPQLRKFLHDKHPRWCNQYLTQSANTHGSNYTGSVSVRGEVNQEEVLERLGELKSGGGRLQLLAAIPESVGTYREVRDIKADSRVTISSGTIDRYYRELEREYGFLEVQEGPHRNSVTLTPSGQYAQRLLTDDYRVRHPQQVQLGDHLTHPPQSNTSIVSKGNSHHPAEEGKPFEESLGTNARGLRGPNPHGLSPDECWLDEQELVHRFAVGKRADGVTLVNDRVTEFDDGRETYLGRSGDEVHVVVQWGDPIPTLARLSAALLSNYAFDSILKPSRVAPILSKPMALDTLRLGRQLGWLSDTERDYDHLRARYTGVSDALLQRLWYRDQDSETWAWICAEAHGLLASATNLYDAAGFNVTIHVRIPDTSQLTRDDARYDRFTGFLKATVPKNAAYRGNSAPRMLLEKDGDKLGYRLPVDIDDTDREAELTANWVIAGPGVTDFEDDVVEALESVKVREQVASGIEKGISIPVEVARANTYEGLQDTVETMLDRLDLTLTEELTPSSLTRFYLSAFSDISHKSLTCSPYDVAEALLAANRLVPTGEPLTLPTLVRGLGAVSSTKLYPWLPPTARELMRVLLASDSSMKRSEILEKADISKSSYERHRGRLADAGLLIEPETHRYNAAVPSHKSDRESVNRVFENGDEIQDIALSKAFLEAQLEAHILAMSCQRPSGTTLVRIG